MNQFVGALRQFGIGRLAAIIGVSIGVAAVLAVLVFKVGGEPMTPLFAAPVAMSEAAEITAALEQAGIKVEPKGDGTTITVPRSKVGEAKMALAGKNLMPDGGSIGYEIFDKDNPLGQTEFNQQTNLLRARTGELERTIMAVKGVTYVKVNLNLPSRRLFEESAEAPTASVLLGSSRPLSAESISGIQNLVSGAIAGMKPESVTIGDQRSGKTLAGGGEGSGASLMAERRNQVEKDYEGSIRKLVEAVVGPGNATVTVSADIDMAQVTTQEEKFDPEGSVVRSSQTTESTSKSNAGAAAIVSADQKVPEEGDDADLGGDQNSAGETGETINYSNSKTIQTTVVQPGAVKRLSVAVTVNGSTAPPAADGKPGAFKARSAEEIAMIKAQVEAAMGFNADRGDKLSVSPAQFATGPVPIEGEKPGLLSGFDKNDIMRGGELLIALVVGLLVVFLVVRPLLKTLTGGASASGGLVMPMMTGPGGAQATLSGPSGVNMGGDSGSVGAISGPSGADSNGGIDIARIEGQVKASAVKQVSDFVERHPDESVSILRSWLHDA